MNHVFTNIHKLRENLELVAFQVSKGGSERESHGKIVECLVILSQLETEIKNNFSNGSLENDVIISSFKTGLSNTKPIKVKNEIDQEVEKVTRRLHRWFRNPSQNNSTILINYLKLSVHDHEVSLLDLKNECSSIKDFDGNYNQMKNFGEKNHGKVFEERDGYVILWKPVREYILELHNENKV